MAANAGAVKDAQRAAPWWRLLAGGALDLLLPAACVICRQAHRPTPDDGIVCGVCLAKLVPLAMPHCDRCGHARLSLTVPLPPDAANGPTTAATAAPARDLGLPPCRWCARLHVGIRAVRSVCRMDTGSGAQLVHALKYQGWTRVARPMGRRMARVALPPDVVAERAALVPLPLGTTRRRERGYNQADVLARVMAAAWRLPVWDDVLVRTRETRSQVRLTPSERAGNVSRAFAVPMHRRSSLRGQHVVLVDDVITTAATVNAAAEALLEGGARIISCVTFGRAPDPGDRAAPDSAFTRN